MDAPSHSEGGRQPQSYTSPLPPEHGEQSCSASDSNIYMGPYMPQSLPAHEQTPPIESEGEGSLSQAPVMAKSEAPGHNQPEQNSEQNYQQHQLDLVHSSNTSAPLTVADSGTLHHNSHIPREREALPPAPACHHKYPRNNHLWYTHPTARDDLHRFVYADSPTSASGATTQTSNFSPASPAATWSSTGTNSHPHRLNDQLALESSWREYHRSSPLSVDGGSDIEIRSNGDYSTYTEPGDGTEWHLEPLDPVADIIYTDLDAMTGRLSSAPDSPACGQYDFQPYGRQASEPPMEPASTTSQAKPEEPYAQLIYRALKNAPGNAMSLQELYTWFQDNTHKCKREGKGWQNSIRHNLSMNAGFTKRDRKRAAANVAAERGQGSRQQSGTSNDKRSTEWTLTDEAIRGGIQSTTRYRNKKSEGTRSRDRSYLASSPSGWYPVRQGVANSSLAASRSSYCPYRVTKPRSGLRMTPRSGYIARTSDPAYVPHYHNTLLSQVSSSATPITGIKMEPHQPEDPSASAENYGMMMVGDGSDMIHHPTQLSFEVPGAEAQNAFLAGPHPPQHLASQQFLYNDNDVRLGYHAPGVAHVSMPATTTGFDPAMAHAYCDWDPQAPRF